MKDFANVSHVVDDLMLDNYQDLIYDFQMQGENITFEVFELSTVYRIVICFPSYECYRSFFSLIQWEKEFLQGGEL